jgi:uncharacterized protein
MTTILITGGTGLIGTALTKALVGKGYEVIILTRNVIAGQKDFSLSKSKTRYAKWNVLAQTIDPAAIRNTDYIINLAGANVAEGRWTKKRKTEIVNSRTLSGQLIVKALTDEPNNVKAVISASAIGYYGTDPQVPNLHPFTETDGAATDFLGITCHKWEDSIQGVRKLGKRLVIIRTGIVLSSKGGAFTEFLKPLRFKMAAILGSGNQVISWIHIDDLVQLYINAIERNEWNGIYNAVAPAPVSNKELVKTMGRTKSKFFLPVKIPAFALKLILGEMSIEVLKSATVSSAKVQAEGFQFYFPTIQSALEDLLK